MSRRCQVTGAEPAFGRAVSHSHRRTPRRFDPNVQRKRYWLPSENRFVRLRLTTSAMRTVDKRGIESVARSCGARGSGLMAKKSKIARNEQRRVIVDRYRERRAELTKIIVSPHAADDVKAAARAELSRQPRDASATRLRSRDAIDGRPRGTLRSFGISRIRFREMAHAGELPGIRKASW